MYPLSLNQLNSSDLQMLYNQFNSLTGSVGNDYVNCIFNIGSSIEGYKEASPEQKASAITNIINNLIKIGMEIASNASASAKKEVAKNTKEAQELNEKSKEAGIKMTGEFNEIASDIEVQTNIVTSSQSLLDDTNKIIAEQQEKIKEKIEEINKKQEELNSEEVKKDPRKQALLLADIQVLSGEVTEYINNIISNQDIVLNLKEAVDDATADIAEATENMEVVVQDGTAKIAQNTQDASQAVQSNVESATKGSENAATGKALDAAAAAASSNIVTAGSSVELKRKALDQNGAATTRLGSISTNVTKIAAGIKNIAENGQILSSFQNTIGSAIESYTEFVGSWNSSLSGVISSLGTAVDQLANIDELNSAIENDFGKLGVEPTELGDGEKINISVDNEPKDLDTPRVKLNGFGI